jgi:hypothetical protein
MTNTGPVRCATIWKVGSTGAANLPALPATSSGRRACRKTGSPRVCHKYRADAEDPLAQTDLITSYWDHPRVGRPAVATLGLTGTMGVYAGWSRCAAHGSGGFTVYRPDHWTLKGTGLGYGDVLGAASKIFGYEVDGIDYEIRKGLPYPAPDAGLEGELTIVCLSPATTLSHHTGPHDMDHFIGHLDAEEVASVVYGAGSRPRRWALPAVAMAAWPSTGAAKGRS